MTHTKLMMNAKKNPGTNNQVTFDLNFKMKFKNTRLSQLFLRKSKGLNIFRIFVLKNNRLKHITIYICFCPCIHQV